MLALSLVFAANARAGKIVICHDDYPLSNFGFTQAPDTPQFVRNLATFFVGSRSGRFLMNSASPALTGTMLEATMVNAGHQWVRNTITPTAQTLAQYDAVFLAGAWFGSTQDLANYVNNGGCVYIAGDGGGASAGTTFNAFLAPFGLAFATVLNQLNGTFPTDQSPPLFVGVSKLYQFNGESVFDLDPGPAQRIVYKTPLGVGLIAIYESPSSCPGDLNRDGLVDDADFQIFVVAYDILDCADPAMPADCPADLTNDHLVDDADFQVFVVAYDALLCP